MTEKTAHSVIEEFLINEEEREAYRQTVEALLARNAMLSVLETSRAEEGITKSQLAKRAGLEASSVRRLLTSKTANPTTENAFRLMAAMGITLDATLPSGRRVSLIGKRADVIGKSSRVVKKVAAS